MTHKLKILPYYFKQVKENKKRFELRKNDRDFKEGDILILCEYLKDVQQYSGQEITVSVLSILYGPVYGLSKDYCIMSIE